MSGTHAHTHTNTHTQINISSASLFFLSFYFNLTHISQNVSVYQTFLNELIHSQIYSAKYASG